MLLVLSVCKYCEFDILPLDPPIFPSHPRGNKSSNQKTTLALYQAAKSAVLVKKREKKSADRVDRLKNIYKECAPTREIADSQ